MARCSTSYSRTGSRAGLEATQYAGLRCATLTQVPACTALRASTQYGVHSRSIHSKMRSVPGSQRCVALPHTCHTEHKSHVQRMPQVCRDATMRWVQKLRKGEFISAERARRVDGRTVADVLNSQPPIQYTNRLFHVQLVHIKATNAGTPTPAVLSSSTRSVTYFTTCSLATCNSKSPRVMTADPAAQPIQLELLWRCQPRPTMDPTSQWRAVTARRPQRPLPIWLTLAHRFASAIAFRTESSAKSTAGMITNAHARHPGRPGRKTPSSAWMASLMSRAQWNLCRSAPTAPSTQRCSRKAMPRHCQVPLTLLPIMTSCVE